MTKHVLSGALAIGALVFSTPAQSILDEFMTAPTGRLGLSYRGGFNIGAKFKKFGNFPSASNPGPATGGGVDRFYDDGFNRVDASGNAGGLTTYWGYQKAAQAPGNDTLVLHSTSVASPNNAEAAGDDPQHGFELSYTWPLSTGTTWRWGVEAAFGFTDLSLRANWNYGGNLVQVSDAFRLGGITPPTAPYAGTFDGPGALLSDAPTRTMGTVAGAAPVSSQAQLTGAWYQLRLGPYLEIPLSGRTTVSLGAGVVGAVVDRAFEFQDAAILQDGITLTATGRNSSTDALVGGYVSAQLTFALSRHAALVVGGQYQSMGRLSQTAGEREAELDLRNVAFVTGGVSYAF